MGGNTTLYIEYFSTWKSIAVVELKFYSLENIHGCMEIVWSNPIAQGHHHYFTGIFCGYIHTPINLQKLQNFSTSSDLVYHNVNIPPSLFAYMVIVT